MPITIVHLSDVVDLATDSEDRPLPVIDLDVIKVSDDDDPPVEPPMVDLMTELEHILISAMDLDVVEVTIDEDSDDDDDDRSHTCWWAMEKASFTSLTKTTWAGCARSSPIFPASWATHTLHGTRKTRCPRTATHVTVSTWKPGWQVLLFRVDRLSKLATCLTSFAKQVKPVWWVFQKKSNLFNLFIMSYVMFASFLCNVDIMLLWGDSQSQVSPFFGWSPGDTLPNLLEISLSSKRRGRAG